MNMFGWILTATARVDPQIRHSRLVSRVPPHGPEAQRKYRKGGSREYQKGVGLTVTFAVSPPPTHTHTHTQPRTGRLLRVPTASSPYQRQGAANPDRTRALVLGIARQCSALHGTHAPTHIHTRCSPTHTHTLCSPRTLSNVITIASSITKISFVFCEVSGEGAKVSGLLVS